MPTDALAIIAVFSTTSWVTWLLFSTIRRYKIARLQADIQGRLLQRFESFEALMAYAQTDAGKQFSRTIDTERSTPYDRILRGAQAAAIFIFFGLGMLRLHAWNIGDDGSLVFGTLALWLGLGFGVAAIVSYFLSRSFGLLTRTSER